MAEELLTAADRGAIGIISAARDVYSQLNFALANAFYACLFSDSLFSDTRVTETFGAALMNAKIAVPGTNSEKFHLLGDPAFRISFPRNSISGVSIAPDSLKAMATVGISGDVTGGQASEGTLSLSVYDTEKDGVHILPNGKQTTYKLPGASIFRGSAQMEPDDNNHFDLHFIVPRDITYGGENGRVSLYFWNENSDGSTFIDSIPVGGTAAVADDRAGPEMEIWFDDRMFVSGDLVPVNPVLMLKLSDTHGINITGEVGHKIEMTVNDGGGADLSRYFEYDAGSYTEGKVTYRMTGLTAGQNTIAIRAWDNFNNSSTVKGILDVVDENTLIVDTIVNYPNPFADETQFTCRINMPAAIEIKIYTIRGRLIKTLSGLQTGSSSFFVSAPWDGRDEDGDRVGNGTYLYKLIARADMSGGAKQVEKIGKLVVMR